MRLIKLASQIIAGTIVFTACDSDKTETPVLEPSGSGTPKEEVFVFNTLNEKTVPEGLLILNGVESDDDLEQALEDNLYGKFFADRAEFFVVENPQNKIYGSSIQSITMFYLDGQLSKTKYILDTNVADNLVNQFGSFKMVGLDRWNKQLISERRVLLTNDKNTLNPDLDNYEMSWRVGTNLVKYRVSKENKGSVFTYVERVSNYERVYNAVERSVN